MTVFDFVLEYIEDKRVTFLNRDEYDNAVDGIKLYLLENGIRENDEREYSREYVKKHLGIIDDTDIGAYFIYYPLISKINMIVTEARIAGTITGANVERLELLVSAICQTQLCDKYIPMNEIKGLITR